MARRSQALAVALALCACGENPAAPVHYDLAVTTDKPAYSLSTDSVASITLTNRSDRPVFLPMDSYVVYERLLNDEWTDAYAWFVVDGVGRSFPLAAGDAITDQLPLWFYLAGQPGTYRLRYFIYADPGVGELLPVDGRVSAPFTLGP